MIASVTSKKIIIRIREYLISYILYMRNTLYSPNTTVLENRYQQIQKGQKLSAYSQKYLVLTYLMIFFGFVTEYFQLELKPSKKLKQKFIKIQYLHCYS